MEYRLRRDLRDPILWCLQYYNFAYGGAALSEIIDTFWFVQRHTRALKSVYIGINFNLYNDYNYHARTAAVSVILRNPLLYVFSRTVARAAVYSITSALT